MAVPPKVQMRQWLTAQMRQRLNGSQRQTPNVSVFFLGRQRGLPGQGLTWRRICAQAPFSSQNWTRIRRSQHECITCELPIT